ncbi:hypothetical protein PilKf_01269 [Pillotina sp. SPG140]
MRQLFKLWKQCTFLCVLLSAGISGLYADIPVVIEIQDVRVQKGALYAAVYADEASYKSGKPHSTFVLEPAKPIVSIEVDLPAGDYVVTAFQDTNGNGVLDTGIFGAPKEPAAKSNWNGIGSPGPWKKLKAAVNGESRKITVCLYKLL